MKSLRDKIDLELRRWSRERGHVNEPEPQMDPLDEMLHWWDAALWLMNNKEVLP